MVPRIFYPFLPYRSFIVPILVLSAIVVPCWLAVRLYRRRTRGHRVSLAREIILLAFVGYLSALAAVTLSPNRSSRVVAEGAGGIELRPNLASLTCSSPGMPAGSRERGFCVRNARGNLLLFFPLGIFILLVWRRLRFWSGIGVAIAASVAIELAQYLSSAWGSYRAVDINDVILNVLGACLGLALVSLLRLRRGTPPPAPPASP
jgi:glycopeptide antibiotics resistance protein